MRRDEGDTCCSIPHCTGPAALTYVPIPVYGQYQSKGGVAQPPATHQRYSGTGTGTGAHWGVATVIQTGTTVPPPTVGNFSQGGIGEWWWWWWWWRGVGLGGGEGAGGWGGG